MRVEMRRAIKAQRRMLLKAFTFAALKAAIAITSIVGLWLHFMPSTGDIRQDIWLMIPQWLLCAAMAGILLHKNTAQMREEYSKLESLYRDKRVYERKVRKLMKKGA
jgi:hypothetical protein